jgi:CRP-like cAMP-binding protein
VTVKTNAGRLFAIIAMVMGGGIFAYGISNVVDLFQQLYVEEATYRHKMDQVNTFMHARALPRKLRDDIRADFFHLRKATREHKADDFAIVRQMSRTMQSHVADLFCLAMMPTRMPTLAGCSAEFIHELYLTMEVQCYLPGEHIIRQDEFGSELFFLFVGYVQAIVGHTKVALFGPNTCFGEFAIMNPKRPRLATIQAVDYCETHCVTRAQLLAIVLRHPFVLRSIREIVDLRHRKALTVLTDPTAKTRTLIQSLAGVWHTDGLQALMPPGVHAEDVPELHTFMATPSAGERAMPPLSRLASVRLGSPSPARRKSVSTADVGNPAEAATARATTAESLPRRHSSIRMAEPVSGSFESVETCNTARDASAKARRTVSRPGDGESSVRNAVASSSNGGGDDRVGLVLHQMNLLLKRQEKLESQLQQLLETRGVASPSPSSVMADSTNSTDLLRRRKGTSVTDLAKTIH